MKKRIMSLTLVLVFVFALFPALIPQAQAETTVSTLRFSHDPSNSFEISARGNTLVFSNIPAATNQKYLCSIRLEDSRGNETRKDWVEYDFGNNAIYNLSGIADGTYYIQLYTARDSGLYWSYIWGNHIEISIVNNSAKFVLSPVYSHNVEIHSTKRTDQAALEFYLQPSRDIQSDDAEIISLANSITRGISGDYAKLKAIHDWVCNNIWYDYDAFYGRASYGDTSAVGTMQSKRSVCQGYASLTAALLRAAGIPAKLVSGYAKGVSGTQNTFFDLSSTETNHAWNEAFVNGRWIVLDTTWDSDNKYEYGVNSAGTGLSGYRYFDPTMESFSANHKYSNYIERIPITDAPNLDTASDWAREGITSAVSKGFVPVDLQNNYTNTITRAEFCRLAVKWVEYKTGKPIDAILAEKSVSLNPNAFTDTNDQDILAAFALGITSGVGNNKFDPNGSFTREQAAAMIMNVGKVAGMNTSNPPQSGLADMGSVSSWSVDGINFCFANGIMSGTGNNQFSPKTAYTREQSINTFGNIK